MRSIYGLGKVEKGVLSLNNQQIFKEELRGLAGDVVIEVKEGRGTRTNRQNSYLWAVPYKMIALHLSETMGESYEPDDIHEYYKDKFLSKKKHFVFGDEEKDVETGSTRKLSKKEFEEYTENIRRHAATYLGLNVPEPNE